MILKKTKLLIRDNAREYNFRHKVGDEGFTQHLVCGKQKLGAGFTLVEMIVAIGLFTIVMFVATGALLSVVNLNKKAQAQQSAINNLNFVLENMARSIRTGSTYHCDISQLPLDAPRDCSGGASTFAYESDTSDGPASIYVSTDQRVFRLHNNGTIEKSKLSGNGSDWVKLTDENIVIENLNFVVTGAASGDSKQPLVRINISGYAFVSQSAGSPRRVDFDLQTLASQRKVDY